MSVSFRGAEKTLLDGVTIDRNVVVNINVIREIQSHNPPSILFFVIISLVLLLFLPFFSKELTDGSLQLLFFIFAMVFNRHLRDPFLQMSKR